MALFYLIVYWYLKTFIIMSAKIDLKFIDCVCPNDFIQVTDTLGLFNNVAEEVNGVYISGLFNNDEFEIILDKSTAIKFAKTLRTEINKIKD